MPPTFLLAFLLAFLPALLGPGPARAQSLGLEGFGDYGGDAAGVPVLGFLKLPASARGMAMGSMSRATDEEATLVRGNPAQLGLVGDYYYALTHTEVLGEFRHENLAFTAPTARWGNFGGSAEVLAATGFEDARDIDENPAQPSAYDLAVGLAYGRAFWGDRLAAGLRLDFLRSDIDGATANGYAVSAGGLFMLRGDWRLAVTAENLSHGIRYDDHPGAPYEPLPLAVAIEAGKPLLDTRWSAVAGAVQGNDGITRVYFGGEWLFRRYLVARAGYDGVAQDRALDFWSGLSAGVGIKYERLTFDYGFKSMGALGAYHAFTLNYSRKTHFRARDEVFLEKGLERYREGDYRRALALARAAIAINPYNFKARALAQKAELELERLDETAVTLAYTANTSGRLAPEWIDGKPAGGLPRRLTRLLQIKAAEGPKLILDAGDLTRPGADSAQTAYLYGAYARMPYDAVNVGAAEARLGTDRLRGDIPFLASQKPLEGMGSLLPEKRLRLKHGAEVVVLGAVSPPALRAGALGGKEIEDVAAAVRRRTGPAESAGKTIRVLLLRAGLNEARAVAERVPELDVIILAGEPMALAAPMKAGRTLLCSPGDGATRVGELTLRLDKRGNILSFRHFLTPLDASVPEDPDMKRFLVPVTADPNRPEFAAGDDDYRARVLAYVRADGPGRGGRIYLRDLAAGRDYEVPADGLLCAAPALAYGRNRVAFTGEDGSGARELYAFEPGAGRFDTLTAMGGRAGPPRWILDGKALLATYARDGRSDLYRIDPWNREARDLTRGRFGEVSAFDLSRAGDRLALAAREDGGAVLWATDLDFVAPMPVARTSAIVGAPRWNPAGDKLAWLDAAPSDAADTADIADTARAAAAAGPPAGELRVFDFAARKVIEITTRSRVRSFAWSADGARLLYSAGVNLADLNAARLDSLAPSKVTAVPAAPRSEENPRPKMLDGRDGLIFEAATDGARTLIWMDAETREERVLVDSAGFNSLR